MYMNADHTVTLSEAISAQPHGIILNWCYYEVETASVIPAYGNTTFFIPKAFLEAGEGREYACFKHDFNLRSMLKNVFINDTTIVGGNNNVEANYYGGVYINNACWVLYQVIGV